MTTDMFALIPNWLPGWLGAGAAAGGGYGVIKLVFAGVKWTAEFFAGRKDKREEAIDSGTLFIIANLRAEVERLAERLEAAEDQIKSQGEQLAECRETHARAEAEVTRLRAMIQGYGDARDRVQAEHAAEMIAYRNGGN